MPHLRELFRRKALDPSEYTRFLGRPGLRIDNVVYTPRSGFTVGGIPLRKLECDFTLPTPFGVEVSEEGKSHHITYYEPDKFGFSNIASVANKATRRLSTDFSRRMYTAHLAHDIDNSIRDVIPNANTLLRQRAQELGRPENIVILATHGGERSGGRWVASVKHRGIFHAEEMSQVLQKVIDGNPEVDRIIIAGCNINKRDIVGVQHGSVRINYVYGLIFDGRVSPNEAAEIATETEYREFNASTQKVTTHSPSR